VHDEAERLEHAVSADFEAQAGAKTGTRRGVSPPVIAWCRRARERRKRGLKLWLKPSREAPYTVASIYERGPQSAGVSGKTRHPSGCTRPLPWPATTTQTLTIATDSGKVAWAARPRKRCGSRPLNITAFDLNLVYMRT